MAKKKERVTIPDDIATAVLIASDRKCCVCREPRLDLQIHHIDDDPSNNDLSNLAALCLQHHNDTQKKGGFGRHLNASQIREYKRLWELAVAQGRQPVVNVAPEKIEEAQVSTLPERNFEKVEYSVLKDAQGKYVITGAPTVFFSDRMASTFPGLNGLRIIDDPTTALSRLARFLRTPVHFEEFRGFGSEIDPIWWTRGPRNMHVDRFTTQPEEGLAVLNHDELKITRIAAYNSSAYYKAFIYVEAAGMNPTGANDLDEGYIQRMLQRKSYAFEEFGWLNGEAFKPEFYDDGFMEKDGEIISVEGSERRTRYLTPYNFLLVPKTSQLNRYERDDDVEKMLDDILAGRSGPQIIADYIEPLPKSRTDS
ncbi:MAG: HNH endonuclease [Flavobacteriales bacterium]|nr:HNH endonuclease [Flavobacteriales bacterium]